ncbi:hypothetical protein QBC34DRAFT_393965 [Podospora aff. communis PSN243]|uniref:D-xylose 1-dehydrogenase (NADP(+), D-xylono-1,5-lactone-forming) n=1 Tax=Podospora aff. communis PSN243 TaxID=3040156 RepID=A0AAV9H054_9PEZI|nr:hypothetical protein QBC34DRAFT_393965 [Podospora aff. communis PSN243]
MASLFSLLNRWRLMATGGHQPPKAPENQLIRFGILGAANIAPLALITPASQHPEVTVTAVAARDRAKAEKFAKKHKIPIVFDSYQELIDSDQVDAVYLPLPNALHLEWALECLRKGKHLLLEKPSVGNEEEARRLFAGPEMEEARRKGVVVLEAFHYRFQPAWNLFLSLLDRPNIVDVDVSLILPVLFPDDDIRFHYDLAGGAMMDLTYTNSVVRAIYSAEPEECTSCEVQTMKPPLDERCDHTFRTTWRFPGGATASTMGTHRGTWIQHLKTNLPVTVKHRAVVISTDEEKGEETLRTRKVTMHNFMMTMIWHRIDIQDEFVVRKKEGGEEVKRWTVKESKKAYTWQESNLGVNRKSESYWLTYKYQLDAFVDRIKGREGTGAWVDGEDSIGQMRMIDMAYRKSGLPIRVSKST